MGANKLPTTRCAWSDWKHLGTLPWRSTFSPIAVQVELVTDECVCQVSNSLEKQERSSSGVTSGHPHCAPPGRSRGHLRQRNCRYSLNRYAAAEVHRASTKCPLLPTDALFRNIVSWTTEQISDSLLEKQAAAWQRTGTRGGRTPSQL